MVIARSEIPHFVRDRLRNPDVIPDKTGLPRPDVKSGLAMTDNDKAFFDFQISMINKSSRALGGNEVDLNFLSMSTNLW